MQVRKSSLLAIFDAKLRLEVPMFQRPYVWSESQQWLPLWEDIERKFADALTGQRDAPTHFLGALVVDQKQTPTGYVDVRQVIDGQQRLTTLQILGPTYRTSRLIIAVAPPQTRLLKVSVFYDLVHFVEKIRRH